MTSRSRKLLMAACIGAGIMFCTLASQGAPAPAGAQLKSKEKLRAEIVGLPLVIYVGEELNYLLHVENPVAEPQTIRAVHSDASGLQERRAALAPLGSADLFFALRVSSPKPAEPASVTIHGEKESPLWQEKILFRDGRSDLDGIRASRGGYATDDGKPVVLVNMYEDESRYRRWAPVKWAVRKWQRAGAPFVVSASEGFNAEGVLPEDWKFLSYSGDPLAAALDISSETITKGPGVLCMAWGFDEAVDGISVRDFSRALDLAIDRLRLKNPAIQIALATPPASSAGTAGSRYAKAIRVLAREHHAPVIDLAQRSLQEKKWEGTYALDGDARLISLYPGADGLRQWGEWLRQGLMDGESFSGGVEEGANVSDSIREVAPSASAEDLRASFPGIAMLTRQGTIPRAPMAITADILLPADAPRGLQTSLFLKDKDGLWFQSAPVSRLRAGAWQRIQFDIDASGNVLSGRGHDAAWNAYYAGHVLQMGLQFYAPAKWEGHILVGDMEVIEDSRNSSDLVRIINFERITPAPKAFETTEFSFDLSLPVSNPFDPDEADVQAVFVAPSGKTFRRPAFYCQDYYRYLGADQVELVTPSGRASWRVRYVPIEPGLHTWTLRARVGAAEFETSPQSLVVEAGAAQGFPTVSSKDPRYFETADGKFFYPLGLNIHAPFDKRCAEMLGTPVLPNRGTYAYDYYLEKMSRNRMNAMIMWMSNWWVAIEWFQKWKGFGGLTDYHLGNAWRLDHVLDSAAANGIYVNLVLDNHGKYSGFVDPEWATNPYNKANGGPCGTPEQFFTHDEAFNIYSKRLRYIVARWGHHPHLLGFEIVSELNLVGTTKDYEGNPEHAAWVKRVGNFMDSIDDYHRPITIQYSNHWRNVDPKVAALPEVDYIVGDAYKKDGSIVPLMLHTAEANTQFDKPTFSAEFGGSWKGTTPSRLHSDLHCGLWSNAMTQTAGAPFFWWFDFVDRYNLFPEMGVLGDFMAGEKRIGRTLKTVGATVIGGQDRLEGGEGLIIPSSASPRSHKLNAVALVGESDASFYVYNDLYSEMMPDPRYAVWHSGATLRLPFAATQNGEPRVEVWNTFDGAKRTLSPEEVTLEGTEAVIKLPEFQIDLAGRISFDPKAGVSASAGGAHE